MDGWKHIAGAVVLTAAGVCAGTGSELVDPDAVWMSTNDWEEIRLAVLERWDGVGVPFGTNYPSHSFLQRLSAPRGYMTGYDDVLAVDEGLYGLFGNHGDAVDRPVAVALVNSTGTMGYAAFVTMGSQSVAWAQGPYTSVWEHVEGEGEPAFEVDGRGHWLCDVPQATSTVYLCELRFGLRSIVTNAEGDVTGYWCGWIPVLIDNLTCSGQGYPWSRRYFAGSMQIAELFSDTDSPTSFPEVVWISSNQMTSPPGIKVDLVGKEQVYDTFFDWIETRSRAVTASVSFAETPTLDVALASVDSATLTQTWLYAQWPSNSVGAAAAIAWIGEPNYGRVSPMPSPNWLNNRYRLLKHAAAFGVPLTASDWLTLTSNYVTRLGYSTSSWDDAVAQCEADPGYFLSGWSRADGHSSGFRASNYWSAVMSSATGAVVVSGLSTAFESRVTLMLKALPAIDGAFDSWGFTLTNGAWSKTVVTDWGWGSTRTVGVGRLDIGPWCAEPVEIDTGTASGFYITAEDALIEYRYPHCEQEFE